MIAAALLLLAAAAPMPVIGVDALVAHHAELAGRVVRVRGRLAECRPASCGLLDDARLSAPMAWVSFAPAPAFDAAARSLAGQRVVVEGVVLATCWGTRVAHLAAVPVCPGRAAQFRPARVWSLAGTGAGARA